MSRLLWVLFGGLLALAVWFSTPAAKPTSQQIDWCVNDGRRFPLDQAISGCTAAIESGH